MNKIHFLSLKSLQSDQVIAEKRGRKTAMALQLVKGQSNAWASPQGGQWGRSQQVMDDPSYALTGTLPAIGSSHIWSQTALKIGGGW